MNFFDFVAAQQSTYVSQPLNKLRVKAEKVGEVKVAVHGDIMISGSIGGKSGIKYSEFTRPEHCPKRVAEPFRHVRPVLFYSPADSSSHRE